MSKESNCIDFVSNKEYDTDDGFNIPKKDVMKFIEANDVNMEEVQKYNNVCSDIGKAITEVITTKAIGSSSEIDKLTGIVNFDDGSMQVVFNKNQTIKKPGSNVVENTPTIVHHTTMTATEKQKNDLNILYEESINRYKTSREELNET